MDYRYHCYIPAENGRNTLPFNPCRLLDFTLLSSDAGQSWSGESGDREILAVILGGKATFTVGRAPFAAVGGRADVFSGKPHSVYIPAGVVGHDRGGRAGGDRAAERAERPGRRAVRHRAGAGRGRALGRGELRPHVPPDPHRGLPAATCRQRRLIVGETYTPSGNWSTYPPHRHKFDDLPAEAAHEEMYYFRVKPSDGFGICRMYTDEGYEENFTVRDHGMQMMPEGYHTVVSAPGYTTYYLWFLAGTQRTQGALEDTEPGLGRPDRADAARPRALRGPRR